MGNLLSTASALTMAAYTVPLRRTRTQESLDLIRLGAWRAFSKLREEMDRAPTPTRGHAGSGPPGPPRPRGSVLHQTFDALARIHLAREAGEAAEAWLGKSAGIGEGRQREAHEEFGLVEGHCPAAERARRSLHGVHGLPERRVGLEIS